ncbi:MAG: phosphotransferase [Gammaproteobacteria bacterium]|nr:phosphotransferase [Gammaproteobacteria bacterium]NKB64867.1 phosphotransferase [Gammaproteobacteria bacterium]
MQKDPKTLVRLGGYLQANLSGFDELRNITKFSDGQSNPTYLIQAKSGKYVLRKQPSGVLLKSAHAVDREFHVISALKNTNVPVPDAIHLCKDKRILGSLFYVMSFEPGRVFWNPSLPELNNKQRAIVYDEMNRVLAALHDVDITAVGLADYGKPGNYFERQINRWTKQYWACETTPIDAMNQLIKWLPQNLPGEDSRVSLIHGDFRIDNIVFESSSVKIRALLDWELSTLGHPYADLAYQCMQWRLATDATIPGLGNLDRESIGIPGEEQYVSLYCKRRGIAEIPEWNFYLAFSFFRFAAILQGVLKRAIDGNASSKKAFEYGAMAPTLAEMALPLIE